MPARSWSTSAAMPRYIAAAFAFAACPSFISPSPPSRHHASGRKSGFLIPSFGRSSTKGTIVGESVYWAINRSMDATAGAEYYSQRGWAQRGQFRARPSDTSYVNLAYFGVIDRKHQGGEDVTLSGEGRFLQNFRAVANIDYLSSFVFRLAFSETFTPGGQLGSQVPSLPLQHHTRLFLQRAGAALPGFRKLAEWRCHHDPARSQFAAFERRSPASAHALLLVAGRRG